MKSGNTKLSFGRRAWLKVGATVAALAFGSCLMAGAAFADTSSDLSDAVANSDGLPVYLQSGLFSDQDTSSAMSTLSKSVYPSALDLRHYNGEVTYDSTAGKSVISGGINYVSPVKLQNPFGSCWAFSICASAETSLLSSLDKADDGEFNGTVDYEIAASGEAGSVAYNSSDLSERALAYSVFTYPKSYGMYNSQVGEGNYLSTGVMTDGASILNTGGMPFTGVSTFSCGIGPTPEEVAPYISDEGWVEVNIPELDTSSVTAIMKGELKKKYFTSLTKALEFWNETWTDEAIAEFNAKTGLNVTKNKVRPKRSSMGTWAVDGDKTYGTVAELTESKILESTKGDGLSADEIASMKEELMEGRAISIAFCADQSRPGQEITAGSSYLNTDNWAQYTYEKKNVNHGVTVVGYDDDYDASNFTHNQYKKDESGNLVIDEEKTALTTPEGNGAWIVKNSWGSSDAEDYLDQNDWGVDGSGYFYLSYYDKNISNMESYEFDTSLEAQEEVGFETSQYDLSKGSQTDNKTYASVTQMCNVFDGPEEGESAVSIRDLGCLTGSVCSNVTLDIYLMDDEADPVTVISKGNPTLTVSEYFDKSGFHRINLDDPVILSSGKKIAIVQTTRDVSGKYELTCIRGLSQEMVEEYNAAHTSTVVPMMSLGQIPSYTATVINEGESLVYVDGSWKDWSKENFTINADGTKEIVKEVQAEAATYQKRAEEAKATSGEDSTEYKYYMEFVENLTNFDINYAYAYDNFSIKLYGDKVEESVITSQPESVSTAAGGSVEMSVATEGEVASYQWQHSKDGVNWYNTKWTGYNTDTLTFKMMSALDGRQWRCVVTFTDGTVINSDAATTTLPADPTIKVTPESAAVGSTVTVSIDSIDGATYQWQHSKDGANWYNTKWAGYNTDTLTFKMMKALNDRLWRCKVTLSDGSVLYSQAATTKLA